MCRFLAYVGAPILLERLTDRQTHSLVSQSIAAREAKTGVNADGCGLGWYGERDAPGVYRSILPAWSDPNLRGLSAQIRSGLFMAHVRSATDGGVGYNNCHPFVHGRQMFMHNGMVSSYRRVRMRIEAMIREDLHENCKGSTDSEAMFHVALSRGLETDPVGAMSRMLADVWAVQSARPTRERVRFAAATSDGERLWAYRWASDGLAPSLYFRSMEGGVVVVSEPFDDTGEPWNEIPQNTAVCVDKHGVVERVALDPAVAPCRSARAASGVGSAPQAVPLSPATQAP